MNYIKHLEQENAELRQRAELANKEIADFLVFLASPKFTGLENGERKDWIATTDVKLRLMEIRGLTN